MNKNALYWTVITVLAIMLASVFIGTRKELKNQTDLYEAVTDTLQTFKNKNGELVAKIQAIEVEREKDFTTIRNLTGINKELQDLVKKKSKEIKDLEMALILKEETIIIKRDTILTDPKTSEVIKDIILVDTIKNDWITVKYGINKGFYVLDLGVKNEYHIAMGQESQGLFKPTKSYVEIVNKNPYTITTDAKGYRKVENISRWDVGFHIGFGGQFGFIHQKFDYGPQIGVGFNYKIF